MLFIFFRKRESPKPVKDVIDNLTFYPNPVSDKLTIENAELESTIIICNIMGDIIIEKKVNSSSFQIDTRKLSPGIYIIRNTRTRSYKFIKI